MDYRLDFFHSEDGSDGRGAVYVFFLTFSDDLDGFPVLVREVENGSFRVDWDVYVEFRDRLFRGIVESRPSDPQAFRIVMQRVTYWEDDRDEIAEVDDFLCYKIDPPYPGFTKHAFVPRDSALGQMLADRVSWESDPLAAEAELAWKELGNGRKYLFLTGLVADRGLSDFIKIT